MFNYTELTIRNACYISPEIQERLRHTKLLIAGCGVGSVFAEVVLRLGCEHLILVDGDTIDPHNLNRQNYVDTDVGEFKVTALARRLRAINPAANIEELPLFIDTDNVSSIVAKSDVIFDTIDFVDLVGVIALHDEADRQAKPVIGAMNIGWGAGVIYFPVDKTCTFRDLYGLPPTGSVAAFSHTERFAHLFAKVSNKLPANVNYAVQAGLQKMADGSACPMAQIAVGTFCVASLAGTVLVRVLANLPIVAAPKMIYVDMGRFCATSGIDLLNIEATTPVSLQQM